MRWTIAPMLMACCLASIGCNRGSDSSSGAQTAPSAPATTFAEDDILRIDVAVTPHPMRLSDEPELTLTLTHPENIQVSPPPFGESLGEFQILDSKQHLPVTREGKQVQRVTYSLEPKTTGKLIIPPIDVAYRNGPRSHVVTTESFEVEVAVAVSTRPQLADLQGLSDPVSLPAPASAWAWVVAGAVAVLLAGLAAFVVFRRKPTPPPPTALQLARRALDDLLHSDLAERDVKEFYVQLTGIVRRFIEGTTGLRAPEQTTEEFLREIHDSEHFHKEQKSRLKAFLESADLVKYAAYQPRGEDLDDAVRRAREFIDVAPRPGQESAS